MYWFTVLGTESRISGLLGKPVPRPTPQLVLLLFNFSGCLNVFRRKTLGKIFISFVFLCQKQDYVIPPKGIPSQNMN